MGYCRLRWRGRACEETLEWETDVVVRVEDTRLRWRATDGRETGDVDFQKLDVGRRSCTTSSSTSRTLGASTRMVLRGCLNARVRDDLRAFKELAESGAVAPSP